MEKHGVARFPLGWVAVVVGFGVDDTSLENSIGPRERYGVVKFP